MAVIKAPPAGAVGQEEEDPLTAHPLMALTLSITDNRVATAALSLARWRVAGLSGWILRRGNATCKGSDTWEAWGAHGRAQICSPKRARSGVEAAVPGLEFERPAAQSEIASRTLAPSQISHWNGLTAVTASRGLNLGAKPQGLL
jgi:hypothetical protein